MLKLKHARVAELADAPDLGSGGETRGGSSPPFRTKSLHPRYFRFSLALAVMIVFADHGPVIAQGQPEPSPFNDRVAAMLLGQIKESLQGHSQKKLLASFDLTKMKDGARFRQQVNSFFDQTGAIRVHFNL